MKQSTKERLIWCAIFVGVIICSPLAYFVHEKESDRSWH